MTARESFTIGGLPIESQTGLKQSLDCMDEPGPPHTILDARGRSNGIERVSSGAVQTVRNSTKPHIDTDVVMSISGSRGDTFCLGSTRSGKLVTPQTFAKMRRGSGRPMVNFLCFRGDSGDDKALLSTILEELFELYPEIKQLVHTVLSDKPEISELPFSEQFNLLIRRPICALLESFAIQNPIVLCVDGPDGRDRSPEAKDARRAFIGSIYHVTRGYSPFVILISGHPNANSPATFDRFGARRRAVDVDESRTSVSVGNGPQSRENDLRNVQSMFTNAQNIRIFGGEFTNNIAHFHGSESSAFPLAVLGLQAASFSSHSHFSYPSVVPPPLIIHQPSPFDVALYTPSPYRELKITIAPLALWLLFKMWIQRRTIV